MEVTIQLMCQNKGCDLNALEFVRRERNRWLNWSLLRGVENHPSRLWHLWDPCINHFQFLIFVTNFLENICGTQGDSFVLKVSRWLDHFQTVLAKKMSRIMSSMSTGSAWKIQDNEGFPRWILQPYQHFHQAPKWSWKIVAFAELILVCSCCCWWQVAQEARMWENLHIPMSQLWGVLPSVTDANQQHTSLEFSQLTTQGSDDWQCYARNDSFA